MRFMHGAPDLAVGVRSPDDTIDEMQAKARRWLAAGSREVWLVDGLRSTVEVWRPDAAPTLLHRGDTLLAPGLLPGFSLDLTRLFRRR